MVVHIIVYVHILSRKHTFGKGPPTGKSPNQSACSSRACTCKLNSNVEKFHSDPRFHQGNMGKPTPKKSRCRLSREEETVFINNGFTATLQHAVIQRGWDKKDIEDFIIMYNHNNSTFMQSGSLSCPGISSWQDASVVKDSETPPTPKISVLSGPPKFSKRRIFEKLKVS